VARQTATKWRARWRSGGAAALRNRRVGRLPAVPDSQVSAIEQALLAGAVAHGFDSDGWTSARVAVVVQRITGAQVGRSTVRLLLRERLGWCYQPASSGVTAHPLPAPVSATDSLAAAAAAALVNPGKDEPGISDTALAERLGVGGRTIQRDIQALQAQGIQRRRRRSDRTRLVYAGIYRRFIAWLTDELGRLPTGEDLSDDVLVRWIAQRARVGGRGGRGLSSASLRQECTALRQLVRQAGRPELAASLRTFRKQAPPPATISPAQYERLLLEPDLTTRVGVRDRAILRLLGDVGLRPSEVCALKLGDIIWSGDGQVPAQLKVAWGKGRIVQLTVQAAAALAGWLLQHPNWRPDERGWEPPGEAPLFVALGPPNPLRRAITETGLLTRVLRYAQQAGIPAHLRYPSSLRHFWATQQAARGTTPAELQAQGGWVDPRSAQVSFHQSPAAAVLSAAPDLDGETPPAR
jgi:integrase